ALQIVAGGGERAAAVVAARGRIARDNRVLERHGAPRTEDASAGAGRGSIPADRAIGEGHGWTIRPDAAAACATRGRVAAHGGVDECERAARVSAYDSPAADGGCVPADRALTKRQHAGIGNRPTLGPAIPTYGHIGQCQDRRVRA